MCPESLRFLSAKRDDDDSTASSDKCSQFLAASAIWCVLSNAAAIIRKRICIPLFVPRSGTCFLFLCLFSLYHANIAGGGGEGSRQFQAGLQFFKGP